MAMEVMGSAKDGFATKLMDWEADPFHCIVVNETGAGTTYTFSSAHVFQTSISAGAIITTGPALDNCQVTNGAFTADTPYVFPAFSGATGESIFVVHTATLRLIARWTERVGGGALSIVPNNDEVWVTLPSPLFSW